MTWAVKRHPEKKKPIPQNRKRRENREKRSDKNDSVNFEETGTTLRF